MNLLWPELQVDPKGLLAALAVSGLLLGYLSWSDLRRDRYVPDRGTLPLLALALALPPLIYDDLWSHYIAAAAISMFVLFAWFIGAWADGDLKIFVAYALFLGLGALPVIVLACFIILLYSVPTMWRAFREKRDAPRGQRLGTSPGVPGIALALPLGFWLWSPYEEAAALLLLFGALGVLVSEISFRLGKEEIQKEEEKGGSS